ncbi:MAG: CAP domain-containing protein [Microcoleus sp.]
MFEQINNAATQPLDILNEGGLTPERFASATNQSFVDKVLELTNIERTKFGLSPLTFNAQLLNAAANHTENMALQDFFSHTGKDGSSIGSRITATGYKFSAAAENIAAGSSTPEQVVASWMNSAGHRANILDPKLKEIGIGYYFLANDTGTENWNHYWTQVFATSLDGTTTPISTPTPIPTPTPTPTPTPNLSASITTPIANATGDGSPTTAPKNTVSGGNYFLSDSADAQLPTSPWGIANFCPFWERQSHRRRRCRYY